MRFSAVQALFGTQTESGEEQGPRCFGLLLDFLESQPQQQATEGENNLLVLFSEPQGAKVLSWAPLVDWLESHLDSISLTRQGSPLLDISSALQGQLSPLWVQCQVQAPTSGVSWGVYHSEKYTVIDNVAISNRHGKSKMQCNQNLHQFLKLALKVSSSQWHRTSLSLVIRLGFWHSVHSSGNVFETRWPPNTSWKRLGLNCGNRHCIHHIWRAAPWNVCFRNSSPS